MKADKIFINGRVYTVNKERDWAEAVCVADNKIIFVGSTDAALEYKDDDTQVIDLQKKMLLPGFIEAHAHPMLAALWKSGIVMEITMSLEEVLDTIRTYISEHPEQETYFGQGYSEWMFGDEGPHREVLDEIMADKPVFVLGAGGHSGWCNTKALEVAGVTRDTPDPQPGTQFFRRDENGEPTGSIVEWGALSIVNSAVEAFDREKITETLVKFSNQYSAAGVTSIIDAGIMKEYEDIMREITAEVSREGRLKQRIIGCEGIFGAEDVPGVIDRLKTARDMYTGDKFAVTFLKIIEDGAFEARSAATKKPFEDGTLIYPVLDEDEICRIAEEAAEIGADKQVHAIGDKAIYNVLAAAKHLREKGYDDTRVTCIHCNYIDPEEDLGKFGRYDVIANTTPIWHHENKGKEEAIGERAQMNFLMNTLWKDGVKLTFGSDFPADEYGKEPLKGVEMGITRQMFGVPEDPILPPFSERLTVAKMIEGYTINAAYQMRMEDRTGSIEVGKYADMVVLEENLFEIDPHDIHNVKVVMTVMDGEIVYQNVE